MLIVFGCFAVAQEQVDFDKEVDRIESLILSEAYEDANESLLALKSSIENTSLSDQDTVKLFFSSKLAFIAYQLGDCENTIQRSKEDLELRTQIYGEGDPITLSSKRNLGIYYLNCDSVEMARDVLVETVETHRSEIGEPDELYARSLDDLAYTMGKLGELESADKNYLELLGLLGENKSSFYLHVIENYSALLMSGEKYAEAATFYSDLKSYMAPRDEYPFFLKDYYNVFVHEKDYVKALESSNDLISWCEGNESTCDEAGLSMKEFVLNSARLSVLLYRYNEASDHYAKLEKLTPEKVNTIPIFLEQASLYNKMGQKYRQLNALNKSLFTHRALSINDSSSYSKTVLELGRLYTEMGKFEEADKLYTEYISYLESQSNVDSKLLSEVYQSLGNQRFLLQNFRDADEYLSKAKSILQAEGLSNTVEYASVLNSEGALYETLANYQKAESNYRSALKISQEEESGLRIALATNLANILTRTDADNDSILILLNRAITWQVASVGKDHPSYANLLSNRGVFYQKNESFKLSLQDFEEALQIFDYTVNEDHPQYLATLSNLGLLYSSMGEDDKALEIMLKAKSMYSDNYSETHPGHIRAVNNLANHYTKTEQYELAEPLLLSLAEIQVKEIRESFTYLSESEKKTFVEEKQKLLNNFKGYVVARSVTNEGVIKPDVVEEWYDLELSTKGILLNTTQKVREQIFSSGDEELITLFSQWTLARKQMADLQSLKADLQNSSTLSLDSLSEKINTLEKELSRKSSDFNSSFNSEVYTFKSIKEKLQPGEASVEIIRTELNGEGIYTALIGISSSNHPKLIVIGKGEEFERKGFSVYKNAIKYKVDDPNSFDFYWRKIHAYISQAGVTRIFYAPDGIYHKININTLYNPDSKKYLIEELDVYQLSSTKDFLKLDSTEDEGDEIDNILLVGRPSYKMNDAVDGIAMTRSFERLDKVADLPGTEEEIKTIQSLVEKTGAQCKVLMQNEAVESAVKAELNRGVVHIATHGFFVEDEKTLSTDPMLSSGLLLAGVSDIPENPNQDDGILTAYEIMNLNLEDLEMVVLSACETGLGEIASGEGIYGLQRAFFVGGVESVVMSLWKVDDNATKELMTTFYKEYLKNGDKRSAFLNAQRKVKKKFKNPIYWGAFVMLGG